jgi:outer membrane protein assembly factor BamE (lipoprotein component of BamABCDE complex)
VKKSVFLAALLVFASFVLASCKAPDEMTPKSKDATNGAMKKAGGDDE